MASNDSKQRSFKRRRNPNQQSLVKYRARSKNTNGTDRTISRMKPSTMVSQVLGQGLARDDTEHEAMPPPRILEFLNMEDNTLQTRSAVPIDEPLFQVYPTILRFDDYDPFGVYERVLSFRNNDRVARRLRVTSPDTPFFDVLGPRSPGQLKEIKQSKIAPGMEVCFVVRFKPQEVRDYYLDLVCATEREKFVVPVHALGQRAVLDFPDEVDFGVAAVKSTTSKTFIVRNVGTCTAKFILTCSRSVFAASPPEGSLAVGQNMLVELTFTPNAVMAHSGDLVIEYENGQQVFVALSGVADNVDVLLGAPSLTLEPAYITLSSQKTVKIYNRSDLPVKFEWRAFPTTAEEEEERSRLHAELDRMESLEEQQLNTGRLSMGTSSSSRQMRRNSSSRGGRAGSWTDLTESSSDSDGAAQNGEPKVPPALRAMQAALRRKYRHLRRALEEDNMLFADEVFEILPVSGEIWANSEIEVTVKFRPNTAADFACQAFLEVVGREDRLGLWLNGQGIGPKSALSYDVLDVGDIFVNSLHKYEITLMNKGDIPTDWELKQSSSPFGDKFTFEPDCGRLEVGETRNLAIRFQSSILGEFSESFHFAMRGSEELQTVQFKGQVIGPTFHFDCDDIDYGIVSYDFLVSKSVALFNTSEIPMSYSLQIPQDGTYIKREFSITPSKGVLQPGAVQNIVIDLQSSTVKQYAYFLTVNVEGVGDGLVSLPIKAECQVPTVSLKAKELDYGECYVRYPYDQELVLVNDSPNLFAKFTVAEQDPQTAAIASFQALPPNGEIEPEGEFVVKLRLSCEKLGGFRLPLTIEIPGSVEPPLQAALVATSVGPRIELDQSLLNWGPTDCLLDAPRSLMLTNVSLIPAPFKTFIKNARSKFRVDVREGILGPQEEISVTVIANLDDTILHRDQLHIVVKEGENLQVPLSARGTGTTMFSTNDMRIVDFGYQFTNHVCEKKITLENKGRRQQVLKWSNKTIKDRLAERERAARRKEKEKASGGGNDGPQTGRNKKNKEEEIVPMFSVTPEEIELRPRTAIIFTFRGYVTTCGQISETLVCESRVGKDKQSKVVFQTEVQANFINPLLEFSQKSFAFEYTYVPDVPLVLSQQPLTMTNTSHLPITFTLRTQVPFSVDSWEHSLGPGEAQAVNIEFDAGYRNDRHSHKVDKQLTVQYSNHPQKDHIPLSGEVNFPNLEFEYSTVNFGCVLNDTTKTMLVRVTNSSKVDTAFHWSFLEDRKGDDSAAKPVTRGTVSDSKKAHIPINQVFDILPIRSYLAPGESEDIEFIFYGHANRKFKGTTVCEVQGGPEYEIGLLGDASNVGFKLDKPCIDFGKVLHTKTEDAELHIINPGKVTFAYKIRLHLLSQPNLIEVTPQTGKVFANDRQKVLVRFRPGVPQAFKEVLVLEIAHFEPVHFPIYGQGIYSAIAISLPRLDPLLPGRMVEHGAEIPPWNELMEDAHTRLMHPDESKQPPIKESLPPPPQASTAAFQHAARAPSASLTLQPATGRSYAGFDTASRPGSVASMTSENRAKTRQDRKSDPLPMEVEMEANRLLYLKYLLEEIAEKQRAEQQMTGEMTSEGGAPTDLDRSRITESQNSASTFKRSRPPQSRPGTSASQLTAKSSRPATSFNGSRNGYSRDGSQRGSQRGSRTSLSRRRSSRLNKGADDVGGIGRRKFDTHNLFVIARHVADFGHVVSGSTKRRVFRVTNMSQTGPLSFIFDKNSLAGTGFSIEPEKVVRLPEHEAITFTITFNAKKQIPLGEKELELPIEVKNGPPTLLILKTNVTVPEVTVSTDRLDFGEIFVGNSCTKYIQLHNISPVMAEWDFKKPMGSTRDETRFLIEPHGGQLQPGGKINVAVEFLPQDQRLHQLKVPLRVANFSKSKNIIFEGFGQNVELIFKPSLAEMGPVLPYGNPFECVVEMCNESDRDIEVYSLDFDTSYLDEEEILSKAKSYAADDMMRLPVRKPGEGLPKSVMDEYKEALELGDREPIDDGLIAPRPEWDKTDTARKDGKSQDTIVVGPPLSGKSTVAYHLGKKYTYPVLTVDVILKDTAKMRSDLGAAVRNATLTFASDREQEAFDMKVQELEKLVEQEQQEREAAAAAMSKTKKKKNAEEEEAPGPSENELQLEELKKQEVNAELLQKAVEWRLGELDCDRGAVIDSLYCSYAEEDVVAEALSKAMPRATVISLAFDSKESYVERLSNLLQSVEDVPVMIRVPTAMSASSQRTGDSSGPDGFAATRGLTAPKSPKSGQVSRMLSIAIDEDNLDDVVLDGVEKDHITLPPFQHLDESELWAMDDRAKAQYERSERQHRQQISDRARRLRKRVAAVWIPEPYSTMDAIVNQIKQDGTNEVIVEGDEADKLASARSAAGIMDESKVDESKHGSEPGEKGGLSRVSERIEALVLKLDPPPPPKVEEPVQSPKGKGKKKPGSKKGAKEPEPEPQPEPVKSDEPPPDMSIYTWSMRLQNLLQEKFFESVKDVEYFNQLVPIQDPESLDQLDTDGQVTLAAMHSDQNFSLDAEGVVESVPRSVSAQSAGDEGSDSRSTSSKDRQLGVITSEDLVPEGMMKRQRVLTSVQFGRDGVEISVTAALGGLAPPEVPAPDPEVLELPPPKERQLVRRPQRRMARPHLQCFQIVQMEDQAVIEDKEPDLDGSATENVDEEGIIKIVETENQLPPPKSYAMDGNPFRWVIAARDSVLFKVQFQSQATGRFDAVMGFEVVGAKREISLFNLGICDVPSVNSDPRNAFMRRVKSRPENALPVSKKFIMNRSIYEFGPLLTWKTPDMMHEPGEREEMDEGRLELVTKTWETNSETIRMTNSGKFPAKLDFSFENSAGNMEPSTPVDPKSKVAAGTPRKQDIFFVEPQELELDIGETKEVRVWAFPTSPELFSDALVICIQDNPDPIRFPVSSLGVVPYLELRGPWQEGEDGFEGMAITQHSMVSIMHTARTDKSKEVPGLDEESQKEDEALIDFDRLLLGRSEQREFTIVNPTTIPVIWRLDLSQLENVEEFRLSPSEGTILPNQTARVSIFFNALEDNEFEHEIQVEYSDTESMFNFEDRVQSVPLKIKAEAYRIKAVAFEEEDESNDGEINMGTLRVGEEKIEQFKLRNLGKYDITYNFNIRRPAVQELFLIEPRQGLIPPGEVVEVAILFVSEREVHLKDNKDISCLITEPHTGEVVEEFSVSVNVNSVWSNFRLQPARGLNFGALPVNEAVPRVRKFELKNQGVFDFVFMVSAETIDEESQGLVMAYTPAALHPDYERKEWIFIDPAAVLDEMVPGSRGSNRDTTGAPKTGKSEKGKPTTGRKTGTAKSEKSKKASQGKPSTAQSNKNSNVAPVVELPDIPEDERMIEHFKVTPQGGVVHPGQSVAVEVEFHPSGKAVYKEYLAIQVSGANTEDQVYQQALHYELVGESCVPGITTNEWRSIFEEQAVIPSIAEEMGAPATGKNSAKKNDIVSSGVFFAEEEKLFSFGSVVCSKEKKKANCERFKITNPNRITAHVDFIISPSGNSQPEETGGGGKKGGKKAKEAADSSGPSGDAVAFTVQPSAWEIPPHEHRYVSVYFHPAEMRAYRALFTAKLPANPDPDASKLEFMLAGKGTLPCITLENPLDRDGDGQVQVNFGALSLGKSRKRPLVIKNDGIIPVTALFEMDSTQHFSFVAKGGSVTLEPGVRREMVMQFQPTQPSEEDVPFTSTIKMTVLHNQFETTMLNLSGECFVNDLAFEFDADGDFDDDQIDFKELDLREGKASKEERFLVRSNCTEPLRFEFHRHSHFHFEPQVGFLPAGKVKEIVATFKAHEAVKYKDEMLKVITKRIKYVGEDLDADMMEWDSEKVEVRPATEEQIEQWKEKQAMPERPMSSNSVEESKDTKKKGGKDKKGKKGGKNAAPGKAPQPKASEVKHVEFSEDGSAMATVTIPEPPVEVIDDDKIQEIRVNGVADVARYECDADQIVFKPTAMFQTRMHSFAVKNLSAVTLPYFFTIEKNTFGGMTSRPMTVGGKPLFLPNPFSIEPTTGEIKGESEQTFDVRFSPQEVDDYQYIIRCSMITLPETEDPLVVYLGGRAIRPIVHFELNQEDSNDYLSRRNNALKNELGIPGQIEAPSVRVVEVTSKGTRVRNTKRFHVVNPTSNTYDFEWDAQGEPSPAWRCQTPKGLILSGRRGEMIFEYTPDHVGISEAFFRFRVPSQGLDELFLFVGQVADPHIQLDTTRVDFNALMLGQMATETVHLVNHEHLPFSYTFDRMSMGHGLEEDPRSRPVLDVHPITGLLPPNGRAAIEITFCPREEKFHNYNLSCTIRKKPTPLSLNVKGEGYAVHCKLLLEDKSVAGTGYVELQQAPASNVMDFGNVHLNERVVKKIILSNTGKFNFDYIWDRPSNTSPMLQVTGGKMGGSIRKGEKLELLVEFHPVSEVILDGTQLTCTIAGKDDYVLGIFGRGVKPGLQFSFTKYDFGPCFITPPGVTPLVEQQVLTVTNRSGSSNLSLTCTFQRDRALDVRCEPAVLEPGLSMEVPFLFTPREARTYIFSVPFLVNGSYNVNVIIQGVGVPARLELANPSQAHINFGSVMEGVDSVKQLRLVNRSKRALEFELIDPGVADGGKKAVLESLDVSFFPMAPTTLAPKASCTVDLRFSPTRRYALFNEDLLIKYGGTTRKLTRLSGQCTGMEVSLETDAIPFGVVCMGSQRGRKLNFENSGDLPARFRWQEATFGPHFTITPLEGVVAPMSETSFEVVFCPKAIDDDIRTEGIRLFVEGAPSLLLTCTGMCVPQPDDTVKELLFQARARESQSQTITIQNPTDTPWYLSPLLTGEHWSADEEISVPPKKEVSFEVVYKPKGMTRRGGPLDQSQTSKPPSRSGLKSSRAALKTAESEKSSMANLVDNEQVEEEVFHEGSVFFALPDGSALLYNLKGSSSEPNPEGCETYTTLAKKSFPVQIEVKNWLETPQKFSVLIEITEGDPLATFVSGTNTIDVPPFGLKDYAMKFYAFKEGQTEVKVTFTNETSQEYMYYNLTFVANEPDYMDTIILETPVRQHARNLITIDNPLPSHIPVSFAEDWWSCTNLFVNLTRIGEISGNTEGVFEVDYRPLLETQTEEEAELRFNCAELGLYRYLLKLKSSAPTSQSTLRFEAPLGGTQQETFTFRTFNKTPTSFKCSVGLPLFFEVKNSVDADAVSNWEGQEVQVKINFEPESLGEVNDILVIHSDVGGEYKCALVGLCTPALPQGPYVINSGTSRDIPFRNVFNEAKDFQFTVDDPRFSVGSASQNIPAKSSKPVAIKYASNGSGSTVSAKLFISCVSMSDMPPWVYYLEGQD